MYTHITHVSRFGCVVFEFQSKRSKRERWQFLVLDLSEAEEASLRPSSVPSNTKVPTEWGIRIWGEWVASRESTTAHQAH